MKNIKIPSTHISDFEKALNILKENGSTEIYIFGSIAEGKSQEDSDIDFAVKGIKENNFFHVYGKLLTSCDHSVDLVCLDYDNNFSSFLNNSGDLMRVF